MIIVEPEEAVKQGLIFKPKNKRPWNKYQYTKFHVESCVPEVGDKYSGGITDGQVKKQEVLLNN